jgi:polyhydroxybutyrate depolymerase
MLTVYQLVAAMALVALAIPIVWLMVRLRRRVVRYVPVGLMGRRYVVWFPVPRKRRRPTPVVIAFHAEGSTVEQLEVHTALHMARAAARFAIVYPEGYHGSWNAGRGGGDAVKSGIDEMRFVRAILHDLASLIEIDHRRVYATGFSNGAMLCYFLACNMSEQIAAIAPVNGSMAVADCAPKRAVACFHLDGLTEMRARRVDGQVIAPDGQWPTADAIAFWRGVNGLDSARQVQMFGGLGDCTIYSGEDSAAEVRVCVIRQPQEDWPRCTERFRDSAAGTDRSSAPAMLHAQVNQAILEFFAGNALPERQPQRIRISSD